MHAWWSTTSTAGCLPNRVECLCTFRGTTESVRTSFKACQTGNFSNVQNRRDWLCYVCKLLEWPAVTYDMVTLSQTKETGHKGIHTINFHLYKLQNQAKLIYGDSGLWENWVVMTGRWPEQGTLVCRWHPTSPSGWRLPRCISFKISLNATLSPIYVLSFVC